MKIVFSNYNIDADTNMTIVNSIVKVVPFDQNLDIPYTVEKIYDITLDNRTKLIDPVEMTFKLDEAFIDDGNLDGIIALYYNPTTKLMEPIEYTVDDTNQSITIETDHFSQYHIQKTKNVHTKGPFKIINDGTRYEKILDINPYYRFVDSEDASKIITDTFANDMQPPSSAFDIAFANANNWLGFGASGNTLVSSAYTSTVLTNLTDAFNATGVMAALVQAGIDFQKGDTQSLYTNLLKNGVYNTVNFIGTNALQLAFVGVFAIDYSINAFATEAWDGNNEKWHDVYEHCYNKHFKKSAVQWYKDFYWTWHNLAYSNNTQNMPIIQNQIDQIILKNVWGVWNDLSPETLAECIDDLGYTNLGGLNTTIKTNLALAKREELVSGILDPVFLRLQRPINYKIRDDYHKQLTLLKAYLNQYVNITITETTLSGEVAKYAGYKVRFAPLNYDVNKSMWTGTLPQDNNPTIHTRFTLLSHIKAGSPYQLNIYKPEDNPDVDSPVKTVNFQISLPYTVIQLGNGVMGKGVSTQLQRCPASQDGGGGLIVDQTHHMLYANLQSDFNDVFQTLYEQYYDDGLDYFICTYGYQDELYYASYFENSILVRSEEWYYSDDEREARLKYVLDYKNGIWIHYIWELKQDEGWVYEVENSGAL